MAVNDRHPESLHFQNPIPKRSVQIIILFLYVYSYFSPIIQRTMIGEPTPTPTPTKTNPRPPSKPSKKQLVPLQNPQTLKKESSPESNSEESSQRWSSEVIEPAIKTMSFRKKRGTRMKELMKGKRGKDNYQQQYQKYFGGGIDQSDDSDDQEDYEASSSGRDQFDSDFDLTDSYVGKRGRKKGSKANKKKKTIVKSEKVHDSRGRFMKKGTVVQKEGSSQQKSDKIEEENGDKAKKVATASKSHKKKMQIQSESIINDHEIVSALSSKSLANKQKKTLQSELLKAVPEALPL